VLGFAFLESLVLTVFSKLDITRGAYGADEADDNCLRVTRLCLKMEFSADGVIPPDQMLALVKTLMNVIT
jgi:hypothetical protein